MKYTASVELKKVDNIPSMGKNEYGIWNHTIRTFLMLDMKTAQVLSEDRKPGIIYSGLKIAIARNFKGRGIRAVQRGNDIFLVKEDA